MESTVKVTGNYDEMANWFKEDGNVRFVEPIEPGIYRVIYRHAEVNDSYDPIEDERKIYTIKTLQAKINNLKSNVYKLTNFCSLIGGGYEFEFLKNDTFYRIISKGCKLDMDLINRLKEGVTSLEEATRDLHGYVKNPARLSMDKI